MFLLVLPLSLFPMRVVAQSSYPETVSVMEVVLKGELLARARYVSYAAKAREENYPRIAALAIALAASEDIHGRNFQKVLRDLGCRPSMEVPTVAVGDTRANLHNASKAELEEIDTRYPQYLARIRPENCSEAIAALTFAWKAESQHRDLISELFQGSGVLFGLLARTIEGTPVEYFVCDNCGSTLPELPRDACPVCAGPVSRYFRVDTGT